MQQPLLEFHDLGFSYEDLQFNFGDATIEPGEIVVMVGPSGAGKSTLMRLLRGELEPASGTVHIAGEPVETRKKRLVLDEKKAGWVPQLDDLQSMLSLEENIGHHILRMDPEDRQQRIEELKEAMHLGAFSGQKARTLSGGQRQRVSIAKAMAGRPPVLLMDESLAQLDLFTKTAVLLDLKNLVRSEQVAALLVLHDPADALFIADELWVLQDGKLVQKGSPVDVINQPLTRQIAGLFDYINVLPKGSGLPGKWREDGKDEWIFAHEFIPSNECEFIEKRPAQGGHLNVYRWNDKLLLQRST